MMIIKAEELRKTMPNYEDEKQRAYKRLNEALKDRARLNGRNLKISFGVYLNNEIHKELVECGYIVDHYVAPYDELNINW